MRSDGDGVIPGWRGAAIFASHRCFSLLALTSWLLAAPAIGASTPAQRIISLAPSLTELTFDAGAGARLVGTVEFSDRPAAAQQIPRVGDAFRVDFERVLALRPDLVLAWESGTPERVITRLRELGLNVQVIRTYRIEEIAAAVRTLGMLTGLDAVAQRAATQFEQEIAALRSEYGARPPLEVFLQVNSAPLYTVNSRQIMSEALALCGGRNVFADLDQLAPEVSTEAVLARNPQVIITVEIKGDAAGTWSKWGGVAAVRSGNLYDLPPDDLARPTTSVARGARQLCQTLERARQRQSAGGSGPDPGRKPQSRPR